MKKRGKSFPRQFGEAALVRASVKRKQPPKEIADAMMAWAQKKTAA